MNNAPLNTLYATMMLIGALLFAPQSHAKSAFDNFLDGFNQGASNRIALEKQKVLQVQNQTVVTNGGGTAIANGSGSSAVVVSGHGGAVISSGSGSSVNIVGNTIVNGSGIQPLVGSGVLGKKHQVLSASIKTIHAEGVFRYTYNPKIGNALIISGDDNLLDSIQIDLHNNQLSLKFTYPSLIIKNPIEIEWGGSPPSGVFLSGSSMVVLNDLNNVSNMFVKSSGSGSVIANGNVKNLKIDMSGSSHFDGGDLNTETTELDLSGSSHVTVNVKSAIRGFLSGANSVRVKGNPQIKELENTGANSVLYRWLIVVHSSKNERYTA